MKNNLKLFLLLFIAVLLSICYFEWRTGSKLVVVDLKILFDQFDMKKEYETKYTAIKQSRQKSLDSLAIKVRMISNTSEKLSDEKILLLSDLKASYLSKEAEIEQANANLTAQFDKEVISRLLLYSKEFAKQKDYKLVIGNDGNGTILYSDDAIDVTKEMVDYINQSYAGK